ncbi:MAG: hypothetical protein ACUVTR_07455 [Dehalococcoidia bacterium]
MRIGKKAWVIVGIVAIVIVLALVYVTYFREVGDRRQLSEGVATAQGRLPGLIAERQELEDRLTQAQSSLDKSQAKFAKALSSIEYDDDLFEIADRCNVEITTLILSPPGSTTAGTVTYSVSKLTMSVQGTVDDLLEFIEAIRTGEGFQLPWAADLTGVTITCGEGTASVVLDIVIYGYSR